jgi:cytochrome c553
MFSASKRVLTATVVAMSMGSMVQAGGKADYMAGGCAGCHGVSGISAAPIWPNLAGQKAAYTVKQLKDFQSGVRKDPAMQAMAAAAKGKEQSIADWLAKQ